MSQSNDKPLIQHHGSPKYAILILLLVISIILMGVVFVLLERHDRFNKDYLALAAEQRLLSRSVVTQAFEAARGREQAFDRLKETKQRFEDILLIQKNGSPAANLPPSSAKVLPEVNALEAKWRPLGADVQTILDGRDAVLSVSDSVAALEKVMPSLVEQAEKVIGNSVESGVSARQVYMAARQLLLAQRITSNLNQMLSGSEKAAPAAEQFEQDVSRFGQTFKGMPTGDAQVGTVAVARVTELADKFHTVEKEANPVLNNAPRLSQVQNATQAIARQGVALLEATDKLFGAYEAEAAPGVKLLGLVKIDYLYVYILGLIAFVLIVLLSWQVNRETRQRLLESEQRKRETEEQNRRNQDAILRLLDELSDLAEGDLTVQASVTEDITGAIADSVNYAIEALRDLVSTINNTSVQMAKAAQETRSVADRLARASEVQARQIESASTTVAQMAHSMDDVSAKTAASAEVAENSVRIAHAGGDRVRRTIQGMNAIREHIQETSKRIKRLGESSQEIGDIVALINDIADQTNILALNAAIQASAAGEAGRGFAVVADEVQRLAEHSGSATKRIEALVKTIQADTNEAVISMNKSITEVVNGADLAEKAGEALEEIETVSARLAALIDEVSKASRQVTEMAVRVSTVMKSINEITGQTAESSNATASSIGKLNQLAQELQQSVAGFRLPERSPVSTYS
ncbi:MAG: methyl-accepting chemotaxis protein [Candidatus Competibacteraceae bacterium]